jgi:hypothetical protein
MDNQSEPTNKQSEAEDADPDGEIKLKAALEISNSPDQAKRRRRVHGTRAATLLYLTENLAPPSQQWLFFLVLIHALGDFDNPMYSISFLHALTLWWLPNASISLLYLSLALLDKYWHPNRTDDAGRLSIRHFVIGAVVWNLNPGLGALGRQYVDIEAWNWVLGPLVPGLLLVQFVPGLLLTFEPLATINALVPEGDRGVLIAGLFRGCQIIFPGNLNWLLYLGMSFPELAWDWSLVPFVEWVYCTLWWWYLDIPIDVAYGIRLMNNQFIHANTRLRCFGGAPSTILQRERLGTVWFAATCLVLRVAQWSLGFQFRLVFEFQNPSWSVGVFWFIVLASAIVFFVLRARNDQRYKSAKFQHRKLELEHGRNAIRVLMLLPKPPLGDGPIVCELIHTSLEFAPPYTAISYTWGTPASYEVIQIDGLEYKVSPNVYSILRGKRTMYHNVIL